MSNTAAQIRSRMPRIAEVAVERARLTVVPRRRTRASRMPFVALVSMVLLGGVVGLLLFNTSMQQASFAATALESQATTLTARQQALEMDLDRLRNPQRIANAAAGLGMVQAGSPGFLRLGSGEVTGAPSAGDGTVPFRINPLPPKKPALLNPAPTIVEVPAQESAETPGDTGRQNTGNRETRGENRR
jgi:outer membrane murein-binding lipoprotein Lpp